MVRARFWVGVIPGEKFALPVTWVRGIKLRLFASVAASHDSSPLGSGVGGPFSYSLCFARIKLRVVQFRGFSKMTLSSLQAQAPRVILSAFSPSNCTERTKRKPVCQVCQLRAS